MPKNVGLHDFKIASTIDQLLAVGRKFVSDNETWCSNHPGDCKRIGLERSNTVAANQTYSGLSRILGLPMADKKAAKAAKNKETIDTIFAEVQKIGLQIAGVNQNVNTGNSNTAATAATTAAKSAAGAVAGGSSMLLLVLAGGLLLFWFWKGR